MPVLTQVSSIICHFYKNSLKMMGFAAFERKIQALSFAFLRTCLALFVWKWRKYEVHTSLKSWLGPHKCWMGPFKSLLGPLKKWLGPLKGWLDPFIGWRGPLYGWLGPLKGWLVPFKSCLHPLEGWLGSLKGWLGTLTGWLGTYQDWLNWPSRDWLGPSVAYRAHILGFLTS